MGFPEVSRAFGINKVRYRPFEWKVLKTDHFDVHYYPEEEKLAYEVCEVAEKAWQKQVDFYRLSRPPQRKVPIFLYASLHDFIQTNVTSEPLDEGIGGFTEAFKTRVVLPLSASARSRKHVIEHELAHAHQMFIMYGEGLRSYSLYKSVLVPLWFIEGTAERVSEAWDAHGRMVLRDAVLHERLPSLLDMHSFNHLEPHDAYLGYKAGQSAIDFLCDNYGEEKVAAILKGIEDARTFSQVFKDHVGISLKEFDQRWRTRLKEQFWSEARNRKGGADYGSALVASPENTTRHNTFPAPSPVDDSVAYLSDAGGSRNLYLARKGKRARRLLPHSGSYRVMPSPPDFSPDGKYIAIVAKRGPGSMIALVNVKKRRVEKRLSFPFPDIAYPRYSPDGREIAFVGFTGTAGEIFIAEIASGRWRQVTWDGTANASPAYLAQGASLIYASESEKGTSLRIIDDLSAERPASRALFPGNTEASRPDVSPDGRLILFESGEGDIPNLYTCRPDGTGIRRITDARTGLYSGRWARDGRTVLAVTQEHGSQNIYLLNRLPGDLALAVRHPAAIPDSPPAPSPAVQPSGIIPSSRLAAPVAGIDIDSENRLLQNNAAALPERAPAPQIPHRGEKKMAPGSASVAPLSLSAVHAGPVVNLSWTTIAGEQAVSRYSVYRSTSSRNAGQLLSQIYQPGASIYRDVTWQYDVPYYYSVRGVDSAGDVIASGAAEFRVPIEIWPDSYSLSLDRRLVDLFVLVGSITVGGGTDFAGYGLLQLSDLPGDHRFSLQASAVPGWSNSYGLSYVYSGLRPDIGLSVSASRWSRFVLVQNSLSTESFRYPPVVTDIRGAFGGLSYPFSRYDRVEISAGFEEFTEVFSEFGDESVIPPKTSRLFPVSAAFVRDKSRWRRLLPVGGRRFRLEVVHALPLAGRALHLTEYGTHIQMFQGLSKDSALAVRWWGSLSSGHGQPPRTFYLGGRYSLRAHPVASLQGNVAALGNHEIRFNLLKHLNISVPLLPLLFTDVQGIGFIDVGMAADTRQSFPEDAFSPASVGGGFNLIGFMFQAQPVAFSVEIARRIDRRQGSPTIYGRLGPLF